MQIEFKPEKTENNISYNMLQSWVELGLHAGFGDRSLDVRSNPSIWQQFSTKKLLLLKQVHGAEVVDLRGSNNLPAMLETRPEADAWIADFSSPQMQEYALGIETADCNPVLISVLKSKKVALCHCGWRGAVLDLLPKVLRSLLVESSEESIKIAIGPAASGACYEVGSEVASAVEQAWQRVSSQPKCGAVIKQHNRLFADVAELLIQQATFLGVPAENISRLSHCTISDENYFSYRRDQKNPGRQVSFVELVK